MYMLILLTVDQEQEGKEILVMDITPIGLMNELIKHTQAQKQKLLISTIIEYISTSYFGINRYNIR